MENNHSKISTEEWVSTKRDISCNSSKIEELKNEFKQREPAQETEKRLNQYNVEIVRMRDKLTNIGEKIDEHIKQQHKDFVEIKEAIKDFIESADKKYASDKDFQFWKQLLVIGIFASIVLGVVGLLLQKFFH